MKAFSLCHAVLCYIFYLLTLRTVKKDKKNSKCNTASFKSNGSCVDLEMYRKMKNHMKRCTLPLVLINNHYIENFQIKSTYTTLCWNQCYSVEDGVFIEISDPDQSTLRHWSGNWGFYVAPWNLVSLCPQSSKRCKLDWWITNAAPSN